MGYHQCPCSDSAGRYSVLDAEKAYLVYQTRVCRTRTGCVVRSGTALIYTSTSDVVVKSTDWFNLIGYGYVRSQMMVIPLIMVSIISAIMKLKGGKNLGKMSGLIITVASDDSRSRSRDYNRAGVRFVRRQYPRRSRRSRVHRKNGSGMLRAVRSRRDPGFHSEQSVCRHDGARRTSTIAVVIFSAFIGIAVLGLDRKTRSRRKRSAI